MTTRDARGRRAAGSRASGGWILFNWPQYVAGATVVIVALVVASARGLPDSWRAVALPGARLAASWPVASLVAVWLAYDVSPLHRWRWLLALLPQPPTRWCVMIPGYDEVSAPLRQLLPARE